MRNAEDMEELDAYYRNVSPPEQSHSVGYCPLCPDPRELSALTVAARGYCEIHGWIWADWNPKAPA